MAKKTARNGNSAANLGFKAKIWAAADAHRNNMDAADKHVVLGLIFLNYISDAFEAMHAELHTQTKQGADPENPDEYRADNIFWMPKEARWSHLKAKAPQSAISRKVGDISIYGRECDYTTWRLAMMNLAIRGIDAQVAYGNSSHNDGHFDLKADHVLRNPPFDDCNWRGELTPLDDRV